MSPAVVEDVKVRSDEAFKNDPPILVNQTNYLIIYFAHRIRQDSDFAAYFRQPRDVNKLADEQRFLRKKIKYDPTDLEFPSDND